MKEKIFLLFSLVIISLGFASCTTGIPPGIPHQFYGDVVVNEVSAPDNNIITAVIDGQTYTTITKNGKYGLNPNTFYIEDPNSDRNGKTINFYVGGKPAGEFIFENNKLTKLDFNLKTTCGDSYCLGDETCDNCEIDCGICTDPPIITVHSPENNKIYTNSKIDLKVSADQEVFFWMYSLNSADPTSFKPNITLNVGNGTHSLQIIAINRNVGTSTIQFTAIVPICGDGICESENGETCSNCPQDCGVCPSSGGSGSSGSGSSSGSSSSAGSGSGGGGGSGGGIESRGIRPLRTTPENTQTTSTLAQEDNSQEQESSTSTEEQKNIITSITGAFINFVDKRSKTDLIFIIISLFIVITALVYLKRKR